jgi:excisionase family DNA binding protein
VTVIRRRESVPGSGLRSPKRYVDADVVAEYLGVSLSTVHDKSNRGEIPHYRIGARKKFVLSEIDEWMNTECRRQTGAR